MMFRNLKPTKIEDNKIKKELKELNKLYRKLNKKGGK